MQLDWRSMLWRQFGAAMDMFADTLHLCPDRLWTAAVYQDAEDERYGQFWFIAFHTLRWSDVFLNGTLDGFQLPAPFLLGKLPDQPYAKSEVIAYLDQLREKCRLTFATLTEERAQERCVFEWMEHDYFELQLYSMRHVQEHAAQLSLALGAHGVTGMDWILRARDESQQDGTPS